MKGNFYFLIVIMAIMLLVIILSLRMEYYTSKLLPLLMGSIVFVLGTIGLVQEILARDKPEVTISQAKMTVEVEDKVKAGFRAYLPVGSWVLGVALAIYLVGFLITIPVFIFTYMKSHGVRWIIAIIFTVVTTGIIYGGFEVLLRVELYRGLHFRWLDF